MPQSTVPAGEEIPIICFTKHHFRHRKDYENATECLRKAVGAHAASLSGDKSTIRSTFVRPKELFSDVNTDIKEFDLYNLSPGSTVTHIGKAKRSPTTVDGSRETLGRGTVVVHDPKKDIVLWTQNAGAQVSLDNGGQMSVSKWHDPDHGFESLRYFPTDSQHTTKRGPFTQKNFGRYYVRTVIVPSEGPAGQ